MATQNPTRSDYERFLDLVRTALAEGHWNRLVLAKPRGAEEGPERIVARPVLLRGEPMVSIVQHFPRRDETHNLSVDAALDWLGARIANQFAHAHWFGTDLDAQLLTSKKSHSTLRLQRKAEPGDLPELSHDREKQRWVDASRPFLQALGVTNASHEVVPAMARKWRQINKFVEILAHALQASPLAQATALTVADFGAGKGYLTFALHDWLRHTRGVAAEVTGIELRPDLVASGNALAAQLGLEGMRFEAGDIEAQSPRPIDIVIALHACDVATDQAMFLGVRSGAQIIVCSPCCHHELRPQLLTPHPLAPLLKHGVHREQLAEMLTDSLRALLLDACGYDTQVFEFVALSHTNKNKMVLAVRRPSAQQKPEALTQLSDIKAFYGIRDQCLERLLTTQSLFPEPI